MADKVALRSPYFITRQALATAQSVVCQIWIEGALKYTLLKSVTAGQYVYFEVSELVRDYLVINYDGSPQRVNGILGTEINFDVRIYFYPTTDGTGNALSPTYTQDDNEGFDAYGYFYEGANWIPPYPLNFNECWLISPKLGTITDWEIFVPENKSGYLPYMLFNGSKPQVDYASYNGTQNSITIGVGVTCTINRIPCSKYEPQRITFVNKYGQFQDLWFALKKVLTTSTTKEEYQGINLTSSILYPQFPIYQTTYDTTKPTRVVYNKEAKERITLNSGYYPEAYNAVFEQLLESEQVWIQFLNSEDQTQYLPLNVITSSFTKKTKLNDKLINYTIEFAEAYDKINNIR